MNPNILLIILDSVRASNMQIYDHIPRTTPFLATFADNTTIYTNARSPSIGSRPSHASMFTGHHAVNTGISGDRKLKQGTTIWEKLRNNGYNTAIFSDNPFLRSNRYGFIHGFETVKTRSEDYVDVPFSGGLDPRMEDNITNVVSGLRNSIRSDVPVRSLLNGISILLSRRFPPIGRQLELYHDTSASTYIDGFEGWLDDSKGPWAACLNLMDAHYPYEPDATFDCWGDPILRELQDEWGQSHYAKSDFKSGNRPWWQLSAFEALYDGSIRQLDAAIERIVDILHSSGELDETLLVITSDHGEGFGERSYFNPEHRLVAHGAEGGIHDVRTHVPLLVKFPRQTNGGIIEKPASLTEFPRVVEMVRNGELDQDAFVPKDQVLVTLDSGYDREALAVYKDSNEGVQMQAIDGAKSVTARIRDPQTKYVKNNRAPVARDLLGTFTDAGISTQQGTGDLDQGTRDHLEALGYV